MAFHKHIREHDDNEAHGENPLHGDPVFIKILEKFGHHLPLIVRRATFNVRRYSCCVLRAA
jgi:hypothetical protein